MHYVMLQKYQNADATIRQAMDSGIAKQTFLIREEVVQYAMYLRKIDVQHLSKEEMDGIHGIHAHMLIQIYLVCI